MKNIKEMTLEELQRYAYQQESERETDNYWRREHADELSKLSDKYLSLLQENVDLKLKLIKALEKKAE